MAVEAEALLYCAEDRDALAMLDDALQRASLRAYTVELRLK